MAGRVIVITERIREYRGWRAERIEMKKDKGLSEVIQDEKYIMRCAKGADCVLKNELFLSVS